MPNEIAVTIPADVLARVAKRQADNRADLAPYLHPLNAEERQERLKMGDKTIAFVQRTHELASTTSEFAPDYVDLTAMAQDLKLYNDLAPIQAEAEAFALDLDSTRMVASGDAYSDGLTIYDTVALAKRNSRPGAQAAYDDLRPRFPGRRKSKPTE